MALLLGLEYPDELPPRVRDELEQLVVGIQTAFNNLGAWKTITPDATMFAAASAMHWTVEAGDVVLLNYMRIGKFMIVNFALANTSISGAVSDRLYLRLPENAIANNRAYAVCSIRDNGTDGFTLVQTREGTAYIEIYGPAFGNWAASTNNTGVRGQIACEVI